MLPSIIFLQQPGPAWLSFGAALNDHTPKQWQTTASSVSTLSPADARLLQTLWPTFEVFAAMSGEPIEYSARRAGDTVDVLLPAASVSELWRVAVWLNVLEFALHAEPVGRAATQVTIHTSALPPLTQSATVDALRKEMLHAQSQMTDKLPLDFCIDESFGSVWPYESAEHDFDIGLTLAKPMSAMQAEKFGQLLENVETMIAWRGFTTTGSVRQWVDRQDFVYSGKVNVSSQQVLYSSYRPPSDIALPLLIAQEMLAHTFGNAIRAWDFDIKPCD